jgi:hypothetical protein
MREKTKFGLNCGKINGSGVQGSEVRWRAIKTGRFENIAGMAFFQEVSSPGLWFVISDFKNKFIKTQYGER